MNQRGKIIVINGPTGVGKTTIIKEVLKQLPQLHTGITYTTRQRRDNQAEDKIMQYVSRERFEHMIADEAFLEWAEFSGHLYGTTKDENLAILKHHPLLLNIEVSGSFQIKKKYPDAVLIYILPESLQQIDDRLQRRGFATEELDARKRAARESMSHAKNHDYQVINKQGKVDETVHAVIKIIEEECGLSASTPHQ